MAEIYLAPEDIQSDDAGTVLAFLNSAQTANEIAGRIEIENEPDIGIRLGERILQARNERDGVFTTLAEIRAISYIGPERFTEIVVCLTGKTALEILQRNAGPESLQINSNVALQLEQMRQQIQSLQNQQLHDQSRYRIDILTPDQNYYLGETVSFKLRVVDRISGLSQPGMGVTLETNRGHLQGVRGLSIRKGVLLTSTTGADGSYNFQLYPATKEPLTEPQQSQLASALYKFDRSASVPNDLATAFRHLGTLYRHPLNSELRRAMDIHYLSRGDRIADNLNDRDVLYSWQYEQALIRIYLHPPETTEKHTVLTMAAVPVVYRDWLLPWYQVFKDDLGDDSALSTELDKALNYSGDESGLASHMVANMHTFIAGQKGIIGEKAAQQVSHQVVSKFISEKLTDLSSDSQITLMTLLKEAPATIKADGAGQISIANQVAVDVGRKEGLFEITKQLSGINSRVSTIENSTAHINFSQLESDLTAFNSNYATFQNNYTTFTQGFTDFQTSYDSFSTGITNFNLAKEQLLTNVVEGVNAALHTLEVNNPTNVVIRPIDNVKIGNNVIVPTPPHG